MSEITVEITEDINVRLTLTSGAFKYLKIPHRVIEQLGGYPPHIYGGERRLMDLIRVGNLYKGINMTFVESYDIVDITKVEIKVEYNKCMWIFNSYRVLK